MSRKPEDNELAKEENKQEGTVEVVTFPGVLKEMTTE